MRWCGIVISTLTMYKLRPLVASKSAEGHLVMDTCGGADASSSGGEDDTEMGFEARMRKQALKKQRAMGNAKPASR